MVSRRCWRPWGLALMLAATARIAQAQIFPCCRDDATCVDTNQAGCDALGGELLLIETDCTEISCEGACCMAGNFCFPASLDTCDLSGGDFKGPNTACEQECVLPVSPAFSYQGQLKEGGVPVTDSLDLQFSLFTTPNNQEQVGPTLTLLDVEAVGGLFQADLDFGVEVFDGIGRFLEISVRRPADPTDTAPYVVLAPRQPLRPAPYALALPGMRTTPHGSSPSVIGGSNENTTLGLSGTTIAGGGSIGAANRVTDIFGTVGGGASNRAGNDNAFINDANFATVGGGELNIAGGAHSTVPGGRSNSAAGAFSFAAGRNASVTHTATFVWNSSTTPIASSKTESFIINASGGVGIGTTSPENRLHVSNGSAGSITGFAAAPLIVENSTNTYINILASDGGESGILFGKPAGTARAGGVIYNATDTANGLQFRTNGNINRMVVDAQGNVGIGTTEPSAKLDIDGTAGTDGIEFPDKTLQTTAYQRLKVSAVIDPPSISPGSFANVTISVPGAASGDSAIFNPRSGLPTTLVVGQVLVNTDSVVIRLNNLSTTVTVDAPSNTAEIIVFK